jgi:hypothetical protein
VTASGNDGDRDPAAPTLERAGARPSVSAAKADGFGGDTARGRANRTGSRRWLARWPLLLVLGWAALAVTDIVLFGAGTSAPFARYAVPVATSRPTTRAAGESAPSGSSTAAPQLLFPASAAAFGPAGPESGDDAAGASLAIDGSTATAWQTNQYPSAAFGSGTGLLIDMGRPVTITAVRLVLGSAPGADLQVLTSKGTDLSELQLQASATDAGDTLALRTAEPQRARYLLIWFTLLPADSAGTYQASVYDVRIEGTP